MKTNLTLLCFIILHSAICLRVAGQGTAFTYQGRLSDGASPATGIYDLRFALYDAGSGGSPVGGVLTNAAAVSNGLFTVMLDFGNQFPGADRWLEIGVRTNGGGVFSTLSPRQQLASAPYAIQAANAASAVTANSVAAANITGTILNASLPAGVITNGATGVNIAGMFSGNGAGVTNVSLETVDSAGLFSISYSYYSIASSPTVGVTPLDLVTADVNGDNELDFITANVSANTLSVLTNDGSGGFMLNTTVAVGSGRSPRSVAAADFNSDGYMDLVSANSSYGSLSVFTNNGSGYFDFSSEQMVFQPPRSVVAADINGDAKVDLISGSDNTTLTVLTNDGSGGFVLAAVLGTGPGPRKVVAADVNGDGWLDLCTANWWDNTLTVLTNDGSGGLLLSSTLTNGFLPGAIIAADVNGNGKLDLITASNPGNTLTVFTNDGSGGFVLSSTPATDTPGSVAAADVNGDGSVDLIASNPSKNTLTVFTNNGIGGFVLLTAPKVGSSPGAVVVADINDDANLELISANTGSGSLTILTNKFEVLGKFVGNGSDLTDIRATNIVGVLGAGQIPDLDASKIVSGIFHPDRIPNLDASKITSGTLSSSVLPPMTLPSGVVTNNATGVTLSGVFIGTFSGYGIGLTDLNASQLNSGTVPAASLNNAWKIGGNTGTTPGTHFLGTLDNKPLEFKVNGNRALRLEDNGDSLLDGDALPDGAPNVIGGASGNAANPNVVGVTIAGGGAANLNGSPAGANYVGGDYSTIGGGLQQRIENGAMAATIAGGYGNAVGGYSSQAAIGGGYFNSVSNFSYVAVIGGGSQNQIGANATASVIPGGEKNSVANDAAYAFAAGRRAKANHAGSFVWADATDADFASTGTNQFNVRAGGGVRLVTSGAGLTVDGQPVLSGANGGSLTNLNAGQLASGTVPAAALNNAWKLGGNSGIGTNFLGTTDNQPLEIKVNGSRALRLEPATTPNLIAGHSGNIISNGVVGGLIAGGGSAGQPNRVGANYASVLGGENNVASGIYSTAMGSSTTASGQYSTAMGIATTASGNFSTAMGIGTIASGDISLALGFYARAVHPGSFVWADSSSVTPFSTTTNNQFLIRATGGVGIGTTNPASKLHVYSTDNPTVVRVQSSGQPGFGRLEFVSNPQGDANEWRPGFIQSTDAGGFTGGLAFYVNGSGAGSKFGTNEVMRIQNGGVGIGTASPSASLHVNGATIVQGNNNWNVTGGEGDFRVGNDSYRFKIGVANAGGGAGDVWMRAHGGIQRVNLKSPGGIRMFSDEAESAGVSLAAGGTAWGVISDRNAKKDFAGINPVDILEKLAVMPITQWHYKWENAETTPHIGPMAQDFKAAFYPGSDDKSITTQEADGVAFAAIQGLNEKLETRSQKLEAENAELKLQLAQLKSLVEKLAQQK